MHNRLTAVAEEKLALELDPDNPLPYIQQEAYKKGQIDLLRYIIDSSDAMQSSLIPQNSISE